MDRYAKELLELSPVELAAELSMGSGHYLLVEGESDKNFWKHLQTEGLKKRHIIIANKRECSGNKDYVKKVISMINERKRKNVVGVVDMDYDCMNGHVEAIENLYYYKYIDLENVLIQSPSFTEVNGMISSPGKKKTDAELREMLYSRTFILGLLRLINDAKKCGFNFDELDYKKAADADSAKSLDYFMSRMHLNKDKREELCLEIKRLAEKGYDRRYVCNGHDLINVLSLLTNKLIASDSPIRYTEQILEQMLILGFRGRERAYDVQECTDILFAVGAEGL